MLLREARNVDIMGLRYFIRHTLMLFTNRLNHLLMGFISAVNVDSIRGKGTYLCD